MSIFNTSCENPSKEAKIKMVLTGSVHGQLDPCGWKKNPLGGLSRKFIAIEDMRKAGDDPLILDAGDMFFSKTNININNIVYQGQNSVHYYAPEYVFESCLAWKGPQFLHRL